MNREDIKVAVFETVTVANKLFNIGLAVPTVDFYSKGATAGRAYCALNKVEYNEVLAKENGIAFMETVVHEIAHLVTKKVFPDAKQAHGPEFKHVMKSLGHDPRTYHTYDTSSVKRKVTKTRYLYTCSCKERTHELTRQKHQKLEVNKFAFVCSICKFHLNYTGNTRKFV